MGCGSSSPTPVHQKTQQEEPPQASSTEDKTKTSGETSNSQVDIRIEGSSTGDGQDPSKDSKPTGKRKRSNTVRPLVPSKPGTTPRVRGGGVVSNSGSRNLSGYSPRNQTISSRNKGTRNLSGYSPRNQTISSRNATASSTAGTRNFAGYSARSGPSSIRNGRTASNTASSSRNLSVYSPRNQQIHSRNANISRGQYTPYQQHLIVPSTRARQNSLKPGSYRSTLYSRGEKHGLRTREGTAKSGIQSKEEQHKSNQEEQDSKKRSDLALHEEEPQEQLDLEKGESTKEDDKSDKEGVKAFGKKDNHQQKPMLVKQTEKPSDLQERDKGGNSEQRSELNGDKETPNRSNRKRILTESNERLVKKEEHVGVNDKPIAETEGNNSSSIRGEQSNGSSYMKGPSHSQWHRASAQTHPESGPHHREVKPWEQIDFQCPDPGVGPAEYIPPSIVVSSTGDLNALITKSMTTVRPASTEQDEEMYSENSGLEGELEKMDASEQAGSPSVNNSVITVNNDNVHNVEDEEIESVNFSNIRTEQISELTTRAEVATGTSHSARSSSSKTSSVGKVESESIQSENNDLEDEGIKEVNIETYIQTTESSFAPSNSTEPEPVQKKPKRPKLQSTPRADDPHERAKLRRIRLRLRDATIGTDMDALDEAIWLFETHELVDNGDLTNALDRLDFLQLRQDLKDSIVRRNLGVLSTAIEDTKVSRYVDELRTLLKKAEELRDHLQELDHYTHDILGLDQRLILEIRSYPNPPPSVHEVMAACYMLLGVREERLLEWPEIQSHLGRQGRSGLKKMIFNFDPEKVPVESVLRIKEILNFYKLEDVRIASNGAASFYLWAQNMMELIDRQRIEQNEGDEQQKSVEKQG